MVAEIPEDMQVLLKLPAQWKTQFTDTLQDVGSITFFCTVCHALFKTGVMKLDLEEGLGCATQEKAECLQGKKDACEWSALSLPLS